MMQLKKTRIYKPLCSLISNPGCDGRWNPPSSPGDFVAKAQGRGESRSAVGDGGSLYDKHPGGELWRTVKIEEVYLPCLQRWLVSGKLAWPIFL